MTKKVTFFNKIVYWLNIVAAVLLLVSFVLPYVSPKKFPTVSLLSLTVFPLIIINVLFAIYWLVKLKPKALLSILVVVFAYFYFASFFKISTEKDVSDTKNTLRVLSFNVRLFNAYEKKDNQENVSEIIAKIIKQQEPELICIQEYYAENDVDFSAYPYQFIHFKEKNKLGHAIFSKYPLLNKESFEFSHTYNNSIYADIVKGNDTLRVYNLHLQSLGIIPRVSFLQEVDKDVFRKRIAKAFVKQQEQTEVIIRHKDESKHPVILCGDFNNSSFSYVYRSLSLTMKDAFVEAGNGIGTTYLFGSFPMRIDYIMVSKKMKVVNFKTIKETFSDHYPVSAIIGW